MFVKCADKVSTGRRGTSSLPTIATPLKTVNLWYRIVGSKIRRGLVFLLKRHKLGIAYSW